MHKHILKAPGPQKSGPGSMCMVNLKARNPLLSHLPRDVREKEKEVSAFPICVKITPSPLCQFQNSWHINIPGAIWALIYSDRTLAMHIRSIRPCPFTYQDAN